MFDHHEVTPVVRFGTVNRHRPRRDHRQRHRQRNPGKLPEFLPAPFPDDETQHGQPRRGKSDKSLGQKRQPGEESAAGQQRRLAPGETRFEHGQKRAAENSGHKSGQLAVEHGKGADAVDQAAAQVKRRRSGGDLVVAERLLDHQRNQQRTQSGAKRGGEPVGERIDAEHPETPGGQPVPHHRLLEVAIPQQPRRDVIAGLDHLLRNFGITELIRHDHRPPRQGHQIGRDEKQKNQPVILHPSSPG